jgi:iron complex outermembrane receptor protein
MKDYIYILPSGAYQDGMPVFTYEQLNQVIFYGSDIGMHYHPHFAHRLHIESSVSLIYAQSATDSSVSLLPQPRIQNTLKYTFDIGKKFKLKDLTIQYAWMAEQNQVAFNESPSDSYHLLHAALSFDIRLKSIFSCSIGCKNILNTNYIDHLSRLKNIQMPNPGRNFYFSLSYKLSSNLKNKTK